MLMHRNKFKVNMHQLHQEDSDSLKQADEGPGSLSIFVTIVNCHNNDALRT